MTDDRTAPTTPASSARGRKGAAATPPGATPPGATDDGPARPRKRRSTAKHVAWPLAVIGALSAATNLIDHGKPATIPENAAVASAAPTPDPPMPLEAADRPVQWWFAYKFSASSHPGNPNDPGRGCPFGGTPRRDGTNFSQRYVYATKANPTLRDGTGLIGTSGGDPLGATFAKIYNGHYYYVVWNDQFYGDPTRDGPECDDKQCGKPWGHAKGVLAWNQDGNGVVIQVTTPSWPAAASSGLPRRDGNTLGCISDDNNTANAQDFFALQLGREDVKDVLRALAVSSVSTDIDNPQIVNRRLAGFSPPPDIDQIVATLGRQSPNKAIVNTVLSSGVRLIAKPSALHVPPWQFVSSQLGGENLLTATWWATPRIASTRSAADVHCWDTLLPTPPGRVDVAVSASWENVPLTFTGGPNHAKIGVSLAGGGHYAIFGDLNQQGQLGDPASPNGSQCASSQNGRGGMFFVITDPVLQSGITRLIGGKIAAYPN
jgi:hypothetical protein